MASPMASQSSSTARAARRLREALSLEKAISIGLKSGEYGGRKRSSAPAPWMGVAHGGAAVGGQVVHHYDVARLERGHQQLLDVGREGGAVHGAVEHHGRGHSAQPQCADEGCGLPVPMRHRRAAAMPAQRPARASRQLGGSPCLIGEDELLRPEGGLCLDPGAPSSQHVIALLLAGVRRFFEGDWARPAVARPNRGAAKEALRRLVWGRQWGREWIKKGSIRES